MDSNMSSPFHTLEASDSSYPGTGVDPFGISEVGLYDNMPTDLSVKPDMSPSYSDQEFPTLHNLDGPFDNAGMRFLQALTMQSPSHASVGSPGSTDSGFESLSDITLEEITDLGMEDISEYVVDMNSWMSCHPDNWSSKQVMAFVHWVADEMSFDNFSGESFQNITGPQMYTMSAADFSCCDPNYGQALFDVFSVIRNEEPSGVFDELGASMPAPQMVPTTVHNITGHLGSSSDESDTASPAEGMQEREEMKPEAVKTEVKQEQPAPVLKKRRGRRPGQSNKSGPHLWEFIRNLLLDDQYRSIIRWEDRRSGIFRIIHSEAVAKMWGRQKNNQKMTYEKLSRALRHYYRRHILEQVPGRRLVYRFGSASDGWTGN